MIEPRGLIGFAVAYVGLASALSLLAGAGLLASRSWLRGQGPAAERRAAAIAIAAPAILSGAVVLILVGHSLLGPSLGGIDHCPEHDHHLHLCLFHGASWTFVGWAVALVAGMTLWTAVLVGHRIARLVSARRGLARIAASSRPLSGEHAGVLLAPSEAPYCFVAGLRRPRIYVGEAAWQRLEVDERRAMVEHERAHAAQGDLWRRTLLGLVATVSPSPLAGRLLAAWDGATERLCDHRAARVMGDPTSLARALVAMARPYPGSSLVPSGGLTSFSPRGPHEVVQRVEAVLAGGPDGGRVASLLGGIALTVVSMLLIMAALLAGPIHHGIESLLGRL